MGMKFGEAELRTDVVRAPFIGQIISAETDCNCEDCNKGPAEYRKEGQIHLVIQPLTEYEVPQHQWLNTNVKTAWNATGAYDAAFKELGAIDSDKLVGMVFEFEYLDFVEFVSDKLNVVPPRDVKAMFDGGERKSSAWIPTGKIDDEKEIAKYIEMAKKSGTELEDVGIVV